MVNEERHIAVAGPLQIIEYKGRNVLCQIGIPQGLEKSYKPPTVHMNILGFYDNTQTPATCKSGKSLWYSLKVEAIPDSDLAEIDKTLKTTNISVNNKPIVSFDEND